MVFKAGESGNPSGRPPEAKNKIPSNLAVERSILSGTTDAVNKLKDLLSDPNEKVRAKAASKIVDEAMKILKTGEKYDRKDVRSLFLENLTAAIIELKTLSTTAENPMILISTSSKILDQALDILKRRDAEEKASKMKNKSGGGDSPKKSKVISISSKG